MTFRYPRLQQQFVPNDATSHVDCTATCGGMLADADSKGKIVYTHSQVRRATNEPVPDPGSPGLNWQQVDAALYRLSDGRINLDVHSIGTSFAMVPPAVRSGKVVGLAIWRGVLVDAGLGFTSPFRRGHAIVALYDPERKQPMVGDPLVPHWFPCSWSTLERACRAFVQSVRGQAATGAYFALTRDVYDAPTSTLRYSAAFAPGPFFVYRVNGNTIVGRDVHPAFSRATSAPCSAPRTYSWPAGGSRKLVAIKAGAIDGAYVEPGSTNVTLVVSK